MGYQHPHDYLCYMKNKEIGARIRALRKSLGLSQEQVAEKVGITQESFRRFENGQTHMINPHFEAIAQVLGTDPAELLSSYDSIERARLLEDGIKARYEGKLDEESLKIQKLEQTVRDKETIISLMQDKIDFLRKELEKK